MATLRTITLVIAAALGAGAAFAQNTLDQQNERRRRAEKKLEQIKALIGENASGEQRTQRTLRLTRNGIEVKRSLVAGLDGDIARISGEIASITRQIGELDERMAALKGEYAASVRSAWMNRRLNNAATFMLSSRDFNDAVRRISHLERYNRARTLKGVEIDSLGCVLRIKGDQLATRRSELDHTRALRRTELASLVVEETKYNRSLAELKKDRRKLDAQAKKERDNIAAAQRQIDAIMARQARAAKATQTQADVALSGKFEDNKGRLPWPVGGPGAVLSHFGVERMADGIEWDSKGIAIATRAGAQVKAVFEGKVTGVYSMEQFNKCVMVRSGSYTVIYANLASTNLHNGDAVALNQVVGKVADDDNTARHMVLFYIWRDKAASGASGAKADPLDPEAWLRR